MNSRHIELLNEIADRAIAAKNNKQPESPKKKEHPLPWTIEEEEAFERLYMNLNGPERMTK